MNYAHLMHGMQMASTAWACMYKQAQEVWENFLSGVNGFLNQVEVDMRNRVQAMLCPCINCLIQKKFTQREIIFHHLVTHGFTKKLHVVGINMVMKALMNSKQAA
jgi:hypothetical protein